MLPSVSQSLEKQNEAEPIVEKFESEKICSDPKKIVTDLVSILESEIELETTIIPEMKEFILDEELFDCLQKLSDAREPELQTSNDSQQIIDSYCFKTPKEEDYVFTHVLTENMNIRKLQNNQEKDLSRFNNARLYQIWEGIHSKEGFTRCEAADDLLSKEVWIYELKRRQFLKNVFEKINEREGPHGELVKNGLANIKQILDYQSYIPHYRMCKFIKKHQTDECSVCNNIENWWFEQPEVLKADCQNESSVEEEKSTIKHLFENILTKDFHIDSLFDQVSGNKSNLLYDCKEYQEQNNFHVWKDYHYLLEKENRTKRQDSRLELCIYELKRRRQLRNIYDKVFKSPLTKGTDTEQKLYTLLEYYEDASYIDSDFAIKHENGECETCSETEICDCSFSNMCWLCEFLHSPDIVEEEIEQKVDKAIDQAVDNIVEWGVNFVAKRSAETEAAKSLAKQAIDEVIEKFLDKLCADQALQKYESDKSNTKALQTSDDDLIDLDWFDLSAAPTSRKKRIVKKRKQADKKQLAWNASVTEYDRFLLQRNSDSSYIRDKYAMRRRVYDKTESYQTADNFMIAYDSFLEEVCTKHRGLLESSSNNVFDKFRKAIYKSIENALSIVNRELPSLKKIYKILLSEFTKEIKRPPAKNSKLRYQTNSQKFDTEEHKNIKSEQSKQTIENRLEKQEELDRKKEDLIWKIYEKYLDKAKGSVISFRHVLKSVTRIEQESGKSINTLEQVDMDLIKSEIERLEYEKDIGSTTDSDYNSDHPDIVPCSYFTEGFTLCEATDIETDIDDWSKAEIERIRKMKE